MNSIQRQLTLKVVAGCIILSLAAGAALYLAIRWALFAHQDRALLVEAHAISGLVHLLPNGKLEFDFSPANIPDFQSAHPSGYFEITQPDGTLLHRSPSLGSDGTLPRPTDSSIHWDVTLAHGLSGRAVQIEFLPELDDDDPIVGPKPAVMPTPTPLLLRLARDRTQIEATLTIVSTGLIATTAVFALLTALAVTLTVRRGLRPLRHLSANVAEIDVASLDQPLLLEGLPAELRPIAERTNELLNRLNAAFQRERRFTADVAHELRTPVAELRSLAEVALKWPDAPQASGDYRDVLEIARQMERLIVTLLGLARAQSDRITPSRLPVDLAEIVRGVCEPLTNMTGQKRLSLNWNISEDTVFASDPAIVKSIVRNLIENAIEYTPTGGSITGSTERRPESIVLTITNDTTALTGSDLAHLFEPFWRKDAARAASTHTGVGLALVAAYAKLTSAQLDASQPEANVLRITVTWPASQILSPQPCIA